MIVRERFTRGSPPPMRGKAQNGSKRRRVHRITPAYAGKSFDHSASFSSVRDHPRLCGEKFRIVVSTAFRSGSPPPMRGKADVVLNRIDRIGITPAYAGKRVIRSSFHKLFQDHPRLCGEKQHFFYFLVYTGGSPPPMRGKVLQSKKNHATGGITPAYAGKSVV